MTKEEAVKWAELYKAYADGKVIQYRDSADAWSIITNPSFESVVERYRVKPKMKKSVGYRRFLCKPFATQSVYVNLVEENSGILTRDIEDLHAFVKWVDTTWQYAEYEEE